MPYHVHTPDGQFTHDTWAEVAPYFDRYNIEGADHLKTSLAPGALAMWADGGSVWQDNEFDVRDAEGMPTGGNLSIEGEEGPEAPAASVKVGDFTVDLYVRTDSDGQPFVELEGRDCALEGEMPGMYYARPLPSESAVS